MIYFKFLKSTGEPCGSPHFGHLFTTVGGGPSDVPALVAVTTGSGKRCPHLTHVNSVMDAVYVISRSADLVCPKLQTETLPNLFVFQYI
jgi:hypothetical protein